ncbi:MAG: T9SS type A sorting domain-containing protein, partial [Bacteroidota bacterium]
NTDIFTYERWDRSGGDNIQYAFPVSNGQYIVRLYMAESSSSATTGSDIFSVELEGQVPAQFADIDLFAEFGYLIGGVKADTIDVSDDTLNIELLFDSTANPLVNGIEILEMHTSTTRFARNDMKVSGEPFPVVSLYPNPALGGKKVTATFLPQSSQTTIYEPTLTLFDLKGNRVWHQELAAFTTKTKVLIPLESLPAGVYMLHIQDVKTGWQENVRLLRLP